ncbi:MAG: ATP-dependent helicase RecG [Acidobacteriota bacterium]|jgi:predicted HTH transcriptional regulator|nr:ATP-dependent helicase RecG [Acidobacteriota bacterium]
MSAPNLSGLLLRLTDLPHESEWVEFKKDNDDPEDIGEYLSAISNSAALHGKEAGFIVWGVADATHELVGTSFNPRAKKIGNEELESWLAKLLTPRIDFRIHETQLGGMRFVVFEVPPASHTPVRFKDNEWIRIGSYKKKLKDFPEKERHLWASFSPKAPFENGVAAELVPGSDVLSLLDYPAYFDLTGQPLPEDRKGILARLTAEKFLLPKGGEFYDVTNLGAILFAKDLHVFEHLQRKAVRVVVYSGVNRVETLREQIGRKGYAPGFPGLIDFINVFVPQNEVIGQALRVEARMYPEVAIRELVANALIHQDFAVPGTGPMVEIFSDRIEITNPGVPLIDTQRFLDAPPQSRNDRVAAFMRRINICEERGSGIDKVVHSVEVYQLPAPDFLVTHQHTKVVLFAYKKLAEMSKADRIRACYQHAALQYVSNSQMTNASLRTRFSIDPRSYTLASRIIAETLGAGLIKPFDPENRSRKHAKYVPYWA